MKANTRTVAAFTAKIRALVDHKPGIRRRVSDSSAWPASTLNLIIEKFRCFAAHRHEKDLLKAAAWTYLAWRHHRRPARRAERS